MRPVSHVRFSPDGGTGRTAASRVASLYWPQRQAAYQETPGHDPPGGTAMATTLAHAPHVEPIDSLEVRWIMSGELGPGVREWFERFPAETETREDIYLVFPPLDGLSLKFRAGRKMEAKCYLGSPGLLYLPVRGLGRLESWRKWSISSDLLRPASRPASAWVRVRKCRRIIRFSLPAGQSPVPDPPQDGTGCTAELTEADAGGRPMWTMGLEATGTAERLLDAIQHAVGRLFASPVPSLASFSLRNSSSYTHWLYRQPLPETASCPEGEPPRSP
jgi:hypothetical protein